MAIKFFCDKVGCGVEIDDNAGFASATIYKKKTIFDPKSHQAMPQLSKKEFHLCEKHSTALLNYIENSEEKI